MQAKNVVRATSRSASLRRRNCDCMMRAPICGRSRRGPSGTKCIDSSDSPCQARVRKVAAARLGFALFQRLNRSQIDGADVVTRRAEALPRCQRLLNRLDSDGAREVVGASQRNDERRNLFQRQSAEMAMDGAVAAEDERRVGFVGGIEFVAREQVDARQLKLPDMVLFGDRSEKGDSTHRATLAQAAGNSKQSCCRRPLSHPASRFSPPQDRRDLSGPGRVKRWCSARYLATRPLVEASRPADCDSGDREPSSAMVNP